MHLSTVASADDPDTQPRQPLFDSRLVYMKTDLGATEMMERKLSLSTGARRLLIVIDGQRRLGDLPAFARPGELGAIIEELQSQGLILLAGIAVEVPDAERRARQRLEENILNELKRKLAGSFAQELGESAGEVLEARLADAVNIEVAKRVLRDAIDVVGERIDAAAAKRLIIAARPILNKLS